MAKTVCKILGVVFVIVGVALFAGSLWLERRRTHDG